jgi:hypothetical protein
MPVPFGSLSRDVHPDFSRTSSSTPRMRDATSAPCGVSAGSASRSRRNWSGSFPAASASSSMKLWVAKAMPLLPGARR